MDDQTAPAENPDGDRLPVVFEYEKQQVRTISVDGEIRFVAADVCRILKLADTSKAISRLDEDEKGKNSVLTPGGDQDLLTVTESGLYHLILTSRLPKAREFRRFVTETVLPSIRKTGRYDPGHDREVPQCEGGGAGFVLEFPAPGFYFVEAKASGRHLIRLIPDADDQSDMICLALNLDSLSYAVKSIQVLWKLLRIRLPALEDKSEDARIRRLDDAITNAARMVGEGYR